MLPEQEVSANTCCKVQRMGQYKGHNTVINQYKRPMWVSHLSYFMKKIREENKHTKKGSHINWNSIDFNISAAMKEQKQYFVIQENWHLLAKWTINSSAQKNDSTYIEFWVITYSCLPGFWVYSNIIITKSTRERQYVYCRSEPKGKFFIRIIKKCHFLSK